MARSRFIRHGAAPQCRISHVRNHKISLITTVTGQASDTPARERALREPERHNCTSNAFITYHVLRYYIEERDAGLKKPSIVVIDRRRDATGMQCLVVYTYIS